VVASLDLGRLCSLCFYTVHAGKFRDSSSSRSRPLPSKPNGVYYSRAALSFFAIWSLILPATLNNARNNLLTFVLLLFLHFISLFFFFLFIFFNNRPLIFRFISLLSLCFYSSLYPLYFSSPFLSYSLTLRNSDLWLCFPFICPASRVAKLQPKVCFVFSHLSVILAQGMKATYATVAVWYDNTSAL
jgi:hypothetical protein